MPSKQEQKRRKQIQRELSAKEKEIFLNSLPFDEQLFNSLFDDLDNQLGEQGCNHNYELTKRFLRQNNLQLSPTTTEWLQSNGGFCDCEILANIEEKFDY